MKFSYTALSSNNKQLSGHLEAPDTESAKGQLHKMGLSILVIKEITEEEYAVETGNEKKVQEAQGVKTFLFQATDNKGKSVDGSIDALDGYSAYRRLVKEYKFQIITLAPLKTKEGDPEIPELKELEERYKTEEGSSPEEVQAASQMDELSRADQSIDQEIVKRVDDVIRQIKKTLQENAGLFSQTCQWQIEKKLDELERIRQSNNIKHINEISEELNDLIRAPDLLNTATEEEQNKFQTLVTEFDESPALGQSSALYKKSVGLSQLRNLGKSITKSLESFTKEKGGNLSKKSFLNKIKEQWFNKIKPQKEKGFWWKNILKKKESAALEQDENKTPPEEGNYNFLWGEIDSFLSWLLSFYLLYFFLAAYSIEKNRGLPRDFVFQTIKTPLIINIAIFLFMSHFLFFIRNHYLENHKWSSLFLFGFGYGIYFLSIINF